MSEILDNKILVLLNVLMMKTRVSKQSREHNNTMYP